MHFPKQVAPSSLHCVIYLASSFIKQWYISVLFRGVDFGSNWLDLVTVGRFEG